MKILAISDLHVGSLYALAPKSELKNSMQREIFRKWKEMVDQVKEVDYLIVNGDLCEGKESASEGRDNWTNDIAEQVEGAVNLIKMINYKKLLITYGSPYHTERNPNADQLVAKFLKADKHGLELNFMPKGTKEVFHVSHHISISFAGFQYRTTSLARELVLALLNQDALYRYSFIIRSHAHYYVQVNFSSQTGVITPCWKGRDPFLMKRPFVLPKLGYILFEKKRNWDVFTGLFDLPRSELAKL